MLCTGALLRQASASLHPHALNNTSPKGNHQHIKSHGHKNFESALRTYDKDLFLAALDLIEKLKVEIKGFYHVSTTVGHWNEVLEEHLMVLDGKRFATNLFSPRTKNNAGMKLSTGWSSVLEIADSVEINFDASSTEIGASAATEQAKQIESDAYKNMTTMLSDLHVRGGPDKIHVKPYQDAHKPTTLRGGALTDSQRKDFKEFGVVLGEINSINELHSYCKSRTTNKKSSYVFLMHNQETSCTSHFMEHVKASVSVREIMYLMYDVVVLFQHMCAVHSWSES